MLTLLFASVLVHAGSLTECVVVGIEDVDPELLTIEERVAAEEAALFASIEERKICISSAGGGGGGGAGGGAGAGSGGEGLAQSQASGEDGLNASNDVNGSVPVQENSQQANVATTSTGGQGLGAKRQDLEGANNTKIICDNLANQMANGADDSKKERIIKMRSLYQCN